MAAIATILARRGTRAQLNTAAGASLLKAAELYFITDENRFAIGTAVNAFTAFLKSGVDDSVVLPLRLGALAQVVTDWNTAITNGWYEGNGAANAPSTTIVGTTSWLYGRVESFGAGYVIQTVWPASATPAAANTLTAMRVCSAGVWGAWFKLMLSQAEMDARYVQPASAALSGTPTAPTAGAGTNNTQIATTNFANVAANNAAAAVAIGVGQTWQSVTRTLGTVYQNTTGRPITIAFMGDRMYLQVSADNVTYLPIFRTVGDSAGSTTTGAIPNGWYYKVVSQVSNLGFFELR